MHVPSQPGIFSVASPDNHKTHRLVNTTNISQKRQNMGYVKSNVNVNHSDFQHLMANSNVSFNILNVMCFCFCFFSNYYIPFLFDDISFVKFIKMEMITIC